MNKSKKNYIGIGIALGAGIGVALGASMDNTSSGLAIGMGLGIAIGAWMSKKKEIDQNNISFNPVEPYSKLPIQIH
jgi:hypothetical protein